MQQETIEPEPIKVEFPQETIESIEVASSISDISEDISGKTPFEWFILASCIVGALLIIACSVRFTPFSTGVSDLFSTLAKLSNGSKGKK